MLWFLGIDSSAYTTSLAIVGEKGILMDEERQLLTVPSGSTGLRQSQAVFQHVQNFPGVLACLLNRHPELVASNLAGVAVSTAPRTVPGSYMPVFGVGLSLAESMATINRIPLKHTSHQEGHLRAGLYSAAGPVAKEFLAVHLSGGTSEVLHVIRNKAGFKTQILGATSDLHAGQLVDRVGVLLGLPFPAGPALEALAADDNPTGETYKRLNSSFFLPAAVSNYQFSFSGAETRARRFLETGGSPQEVAQAVQGCIARTMEKVLRRAIQETGLKEVLFVGGVAANQYLRQRLRYRLEHPAVKAQLYFAEPRYSSDNAVGVALLAYDTFHSI